MARQKKSKPEAGYIDDAHAQVESCEEECSTCLHFVLRSRGSDCTVVEGLINPSGWCRWWTERNDSL